MILICITPDSQINYSWGVLIVANLKLIKLAWLEWDRK